MAFSRAGPCFTDAERATLALMEAVTRLSDVSDPVPDEIWNQAAYKTSEWTQSDVNRQISATLNSHIGIAGFMRPDLPDLRVGESTTRNGSVRNRLNIGTRQVAGERLKSAEAWH